MMKNKIGIISDGDDEIIFSETFNVYNNSLTIKEISGLNITFTFDEEGSKERERDIDISGDSNTATVSFSSKIRNTLGSGTTGKIELAELNNKDKEKQKLLFSLYSSRIGDKSSGLNINITFYLRKV